MEGLARVDVVCLDKTGTLTYGDIVFDRLEVLDADRRRRGPPGAGPAVRRRRQRDRAGLRAAFPGSTWRRSGAVPFSSARKWSAVTADGHGSWVLGAPEMVLPAPGR